MSNNDTLAAYLKDAYSYDPNNGVLYHRRFNRPVGTINSFGYVVFNVKGKVLKVHRVAWLLSHGDWPKDQIDHINGVRHDNRLCNLREATHTQNILNRTMHKSNKLGVKGVVLLPNGKFRAQCWRNNRFVLRKDYNTLGEAALAYRTACLEYHGVFARPA